MVAEAAERFGASVPAAARIRSRRARTSKRVRARPATRCCRPTCSPATPPTTRPRPCCSTCCAARASTAWRACAGARRPLLRLRRTETRELCADARPRAGPGPDERRPGFRRNRIRHEVLPLLDDIAERDVGAGARRQAELLRDDADLLDQLSLDHRPDRRPRPAATRPTAARAARSRRWLARRPPARRRDGRPGARRRPGRRDRHRDRGRAAGRAPPAAAPV